MIHDQIKIYSLGESALTVDFGREISPVLNRKVLNLAAYFDKNRFPGFVETIPAYASLTIFFDVLTVRKHFTAFDTAFAAVRSLVEDALGNVERIAGKEPRTISIPVSFDGENAPDLAFVAAAGNLSVSEVVRIFTAATYRVYMLGFLPGFAYMGEVDWRIRTPRKRTPAESVAKGSVGIAGRQTGIYSFDSPGGWQIIGRTDVELFNASDEPPAFLHPGDSVKFYAV